LSLVPRHSAFYLCLRFIERFTAAQTKISSCQFLALIAFDDSRCCFIYLLSYRISLRYFPARLAESDKRDVYRLISRHFVSMLCCRISPLLDYFDDAAIFTLL